MKTPRDGSHYFLHLTTYISCKTGTTTFIGSFCGFLEPRSHVISTQLVLITRGFPSDHPLYKTSFFHHFISFHKQNWVSTWTVYVFRSCRDSLLIVGPRLENYRVSHRWVFLLKTSLNTLKWNIGSVFR